MGVLGLTPFLQRTCPEVIKHLPDRLRGLAGKTIVIDGTLVTQRLHFAPVPGPSRHVLGWYRLLKELKDCGVRAICVFDGKERSTAKTGETERRKQAQRTAFVRGRIEIERLKRLQKLVGLYDTFSAFKDSDLEHATSLLRNFAWATPMYPHTISSVSYDASLKQGQEFTDVASEGLSRSFHLPGPMDESSRTMPQVSHFYPRTNGQSFSRDSDPNLQETQPLEYIEEDGYPGPVTKLNNHHPPLTIDSSKPGSTPENITSEIASLYYDFCHSIPRLSLLQPLTPSATSDEDTNEGHNEYVMTKSQYQLTLDEGKLWEALIGSSSSAKDTSQATTKATLTLLMRKSAEMSESYQRRTNPPSTQTYNESKEIVQAMGVPCLEPTGPFEAEALAASLVINGLADYVASEDTDVLIYEAPLVRNITNRQVPLVVISGTDVRTVLQLNRAMYIDFALLLGTDFSQRIKNVGPARALKFIREHGSIERVIECETKYPPRSPPQTYLEQVEVARSVFQTFPPIPDGRFLQMRESDERGVDEILQRYGLHPAAVYDWDYSAALDGNYFEDDPSAF